MGFRSIFGTDHALERDGVEMDFGEGRSLTIARSGGSNLNYQKTFAQVTSQYKRAIDADALPTEKGKQLLIEVVARAVLLDWKGVTMDDLYEDGNMELAPCTLENKIQFLTALPDALTDIQQQSLSFALYRKNVQEEELEN